MIAYMLTNGILANGDTPTPPVPVPVVLSTGGGHGVRWPKLAIRVHGRTLVGSREEILRIVRDLALHAAAETPKQSRNIARRTGRKQAATIFVPAELQLVDALDFGDIQQIAMQMQSEFRRLYVQQYAEASANEHLRRARDADDVAAADAAVRALFDD